MISILLVACVLPELFLYTNLKDILVSRGTEQLLLFAFDKPQKYCFLSRDMDSQSQCHAKFWYFWVNFGTFSGFYWHFGIYLSNPPERAAKRNKSRLYGCCNASPFNCVFWTTCFFHLDTKRKEIPRICHFGIIMAGSAVFPGLVRPEWGSWERADWVV